MTPSSIDNLSIIINTAPWEYARTWHILYNKQNPMPKTHPDYQAIYNAYQQTKHTIMLDELHGMRGSSYLQPSHTHIQTATDAWDHFVQSVSTFQDSLVQKLIHAQDAITRFAQNLDPARHAFNQNRDTILAMATDPNWQPETDHP